MAIVAGGQFGRIYKTHDDALRRGEWICCLTYADGSGRARIAQQGRCAGRHRRLREQTSGRLATERDPGSRLGLSQSAGAVSVAAEQLREAFGEGAR